MKENEKCSILFSWNNIYGIFWLKSSDYIDANSKHKLTYLDDSETMIPDIRFEIITILYNIGAIHSFLGYQNPRNTEDVGFYYYFYSY